MHLDAAQSASGCIAHLDAGPFSGIFLHWHLDASLPCGIGIEMQALFLASQFKIEDAALCEVWPMMAWMPFKSPSLSDSSQDDHLPVC